MRTYYFRTHEIVRALSFREFQALCNIIDEFGPKTQMAYRHGSGTDIQTVDGVLETKKFRIIRIVHTKVKILIYVEHAAQQFGQVVRKWYEVAREDARANVRTQRKSVSTVPAVSETYTDPESA